MLNVSASARAVFASMVYTRQQVSWRRQGPLHRLQEGGIQGRSRHTGQLQCGIPVPQAQNTSGRNI